MGFNRIFTNQPFGKPELKGLLIGCALFLVGLLISFLRYQALVQEEKQNLDSVLDLIEQNIERTIQESYNSALTLALTVNAEGEVVNFDSVAKQILENTTSVDVLELVPDGIITYVYPLEGNESVIGYDILSDPNVNREVLKAAELGTVYFAGPFDLRQGGKAVVGRLPIMIGDKLWGFSAVLIYLETLINKSGIHNFPEETYYFQLAKINPNTKVEEFFLPIRSGVDLGSFESIRFPEGDWRLYATKVGNNIPFNSFFSILIASLLGSIIFGILSAKLFRKPLDLERLLQEKSEELIKSREKYKLNSELMESIFESPKSMIIFSLDKNYNYIAFSVSHKDLMKNLLGVDIRKGMNALEIIPNEETRKTLKSDFDRALQGEHFDYIREFKSKSGEPAFWENRFAPIFSKNKKILGLTAFVTNIDKRVTAEKEILLEKKLSDSIINSMPGIFYLYNKEGKFLRWNKNFETITGYSSKEMQSAHPIDFFEDDEKELLAHKIGNVFISGEDNVEANFVSKGGSKTPFYFTGVAINYKGEECLLGVGIDISEQKRAEETIENSLKEKTTLLSEIHHRVKNNLAIVSGLLQLQSYEMDDERLSFAFDQSINRIISIAMVHELMYKSTDLSSINIHTYLEKLIPAITATMEDKTKDIRIEINIDDYKMNINEAIPLGLLLNELFTNSFKYAFKDRKEGIIQVTLGAGDGPVKVIYEDDGVGFGPSIDFDKPKNLGLNLIHSQLQQLGAVYTVDTQSKFKLEFKFTRSETGSHSTI